jgi:hypothetical protein
MRRLYAGKRRPKGLKLLFDDESIVGSETGMAALIGLSEV